MNGPYRQFQQQESRLLAQPHRLLDYLNLQLLESGLRHSFAMAALLFDQEDPEAIAAVIQRLWSDEALRRDLSAKALVQRRANTWDDAAQTFIAAYRYCAGHDLSAEDKARIERGLAAG